MLETLSGGVDHGRWAAKIGADALADIGGRELYRLVEADRPELRDRFLFITGDTLGADMVEFVRQAGLVCLEKPLLPSDLIAAVDRTLEDARS